MGFIQSKLDNDPTFSIEKGFLTNNCGFNKLVEKIENAGCVLSAPLNSDEKKERIAFFDELDQIRARKNYALTFTFDDFKSLYEFITIQREAILDYLEPKQVEMQEDFDGIEE
jgi:hypothetical protein